MGNVLNIKVEPCDVKWGEDDLGYLDGSIEVATEEQGVEVTANQEGANILDMIRTGKTIEVKLTLKETHAAQLSLMYKAAGAEVTAAVAEVTSITCVADVASSLNNKYFFLNAKGDTPKYYVWFNVGGAGVDPAIAGRTAVPVAFAASASASTVATAVQGAIDGLATFAATVSGAVVTATAATAGGASDPSAENSTFTISVTTQGVDAGIVGWGTSKDFNGQFAASKQLTLHPKVLATSDRTRNFNFWKAYPMLESINFSGEEIQVLPVTFKVFKDPARPTSVDYFGYGDTL